MLRLLEVPAEGGQKVSELERLRKGVFKASSKGMLAALRRVVDLQAVGVDSIDVRAIPPRRLTGLATYGLASKAAALRRLPTREQRLAVLAATVVVLSARAVDDVLETFDMLMTTKLLSKAERESREEKLRRYPRVSRNAGKLAAAVKVLLEMVEVNQDVGLGVVLDMIEKTVTRAELQSAQADIDNALIKVERTKTELGYNRIQAPMDGTVVSIVTRQGQTLAASQTVPTLLKLANLDTMTVKAQISEADVTKVRAGMPVYFTLIGDPDRRYHGTLCTVELAPTNINEQSANTTTTSNAAIYYYALFDVPNPDHQLRVAMTTQVTIVLGERKQVLAIPQTALGKKLGENEYEVTLLKEDGQKETRRIKTGMKDDIKIEVVSGLDEQDKVTLEQGKPVQNDEMEMVP